MMTEEQKEKHRERARQYYKKHREEILEYKKAYYANNRELCVERNRRQAEKHREQRRAYYKRWNEEHREQRREYNRGEKARAAKRRWHLGQAKVRNPMTEEQRSAFRARWDAVVRNCGEAVLLRKIAEIFKTRKTRKELIKND